MASKTGDMLHDQNLNIRFNEASVGWKTNVSKAPSKRGAALAGRTPLGYLSNSLKPSMNRATRKQSCTLFSPLIEKEAVTSGIALDATKKKKTSKASLKQQPAGRKQSSTLFSPLIEKEAVTSGIALDATKKKNTSKASLKQQPAGRKVLSDISNSGKPQVNVASKRNDNTKVGVVAEVAGEGFLHNHQECIKAQLIDMDTNQVLQMIDPDHATLQTPSASFRKEIDLDVKFSDPELTDSMSEFSDLFEPWYFPTGDSPPSTPFAWPFEGDKRPFEDVEWEDVVDEWPFEDVEFV